MDKLRYVIDTNVLVSSVLIANSLSDLVLKQIRKNGDILFSEITFQELQEVLNRPKFNRYLKYYGQSTSRTRKITSRIGRS